MKTSVKLFSLLLVFVMIVACFAACKEENNETTEISTEIETEKPEGFDFVPEIEQKNYGSEVVLSVMSDCNKLVWHWVEEGSGDAMSEALYNRQDSVFKHLGVEILGKGHTGNFKTYTEEYKTAVKNKDDSLHLMVTHVNLGVSGLITGGYLADLSTVDGLNLEDADYWDYSVMETLSVDDKMFLGKNKFNILYTYVIAYNKTMMDLYADDMEKSVYEMVDDYEWTLDQMITLAQKVSVDTNADGKTEDDTFGISGRQWEAFAGFASSSNIPLVDTNEKGEYVVSFYNDANKEKSVALVEDIKALAASANAWFWPYDGTVPSIDLQDGKVLMQFVGTNNLSQLTQYKDLSFGVLPYPMYDTTQKDVGYRHLQWGGYTVMPSYVKDPQMVAETMELLAYYSYDVNNTFYNKLIGKQAAEAPDDRRMLELIWDTICTDFGQTFLETEAPLYFVPTLTATDSKQNIASYVATNEDAINRTIRKFVNGVSRH